MQVIDLLLEIAEKGGFFEKKTFTTIALSKKLKITQQTISNSLIRLEKKRLIIRNPSQKGLNIILTENGRELLNNYKKKLIDITKKPSYLKGQVITGIGEGKFYIEQKNYMNQFKELLNIKPYAGTLNLYVKEIEKNKFFNNKKPIMIEGFKNKQRTFGSIKCYEIKLETIDSWIILPERTHHKEDVLEIISSHNLRKKLNLKDNNVVKLYEKSKTQ